MGMFDWVDYECNCPICKNLVTGFRTKDGDSTLKTVQPKDVKNFYSICGNCDSEIGVFISTNTKLNWRKYDSR